MNMNSPSLPHHVSRDLLRGLVPPQLLVPLMLCLAAGAGRADINEGLVAYYPFEGTAEDASGRGHHGVATALAYEPGVLGSAAFFNGTSAFVEVPNHPDFRLLQSDNTDFATWTPLATNTLSSPTWCFLDVQSPSSPKRYYGIALQP